MLCLKICQCRIYLYSLVCHWEISINFVKKCHFSPEKHSTLKNLRQLWRNHKLQKGIQMSSDSAILLNTPCFPKRKFSREYLRRTIIWSLYMFKLKSKLTNNQHFEQYCRSNREGEFTFKTFFRFCKAGNDNSFQYVTIRWSTSMIVNYDFVFSRKKKNWISLPWLTLVSTMALEKWTKLY